MLDITTSSNETIIESPNIFFNLRMHYIVDGHPCSLRKLSSLMKNRVAPSRMCELEGGRFPSIRELEAYHDFFGVSYDYLFGADPVQKRNDSFEEMIEWLSSSKQADEKLLFDTLTHISTTDEGLALLFYISRYLFSTEVNSVNPEELLVRQLRALKNLGNDNYRTYQDIRQTVDNICEGGNDDE